MPAVKDVGEPDAGEPHVRFDGGREEPGAYGLSALRRWRLPPTRPDGTSHTGRAKSPAMPEGLRCSGANYSQTEAGPPDSRFL